MDSTSWALKDQADQALKALTLIHGRDDAYAAIFRKDRNGKVENLFGVRGDQLAEIMTPDLLVEDIFITVNGYYVPEKRRLDPGPVKGWIRKTNRDLRALRVVYVDLDVGRTTEQAPNNPAAWLTDRDVDCQIGKLADAGVIPQPSVVVLSGRGVIVFWLLRDARNPDQPPPDLGGNRALYVKLNRALQARLSDFAPDRSAYDATRAFRMPGSINSKVGLRVIYRPQFDEQGLPFTYTLGELAALLDVEPGTPKTARRWTRTARKGGKYSKRGRAGFDGLQLHRVSDIESVAQRQGIQQGARRKTISIYASHLLKAGDSIHEIKRKCAAMARQCKPAYPSEPGEPDAAAIVDDLTKRSGAALEWTKTQTKTLLRWLNVDADKARALQLKTIVPSEVREERKRPGAAKRAARQTFVDTYRSEHPGATVLDVWNAANEAGFKCDPRTIRRAMQASLA